jgi:sugar lactone lactonase YvrE
VLVACVGLGAAAVYWLRTDTRPEELPTEWLATVRVLAHGHRFADPYGIAALPDGTLFVSDGAGGNRLFAIDPAGTVTPLAGADDAGFADGAGTAARFATPSGIALDATGALYVADTGNDAVRRVTRDGQVSTVVRGLNGPIGVACHPDGRLFVSDTYNDRIVVIEPDGSAAPIPLTVDLDTPTGLAVGADGTLYIADTGNNVVRVVHRDGRVDTIDPVGIGGLRRPLGVAVDAAGAMYVSDESSRVIGIRPDQLTSRVIAGSRAGYGDGPGEQALFRRPAGVAALGAGRLVVADSGNGLVRAVTARTLAEAAPPASPFLRPVFDADAFGRRPLLWPLDPLIGPFEVAGTMGEARGQDAGRFHAGVDVRAEQGAPVLAIRDGVVAAPLAAGEFGTLNEWLRLGPVTYVHIRVGRERRGAMFDDPRFVATRDLSGHLIRVRAKRGATFRVGERVGTVNPFNHVHVNVGWGGEEYNPLLFRLVQFNDTVPPTIASGGVRLFDTAGTPLTTRVRGRIQVAGPVQVVVDAWDQADGNRADRRLGVYALGYQVLHPDGTPVEGFAEPRHTLRFDRLSTQPDAPRLVYAPGSGIPFYGQRRTRFLYIVTNTFKDGVAAAGAWDTTALPPGDYLLRVHAADAAGNETRRDLAVTITPLIDVHGR